MSIFEHEHYSEIFNGDDKIESRASFDEYSLFEIEHDRRLGIIYNFKQHISKEPEFCGIFSLSSYAILDAFYNSENVNVIVSILTREQFMAFKSVYYEIYNLYPDDIYLHKIGLNLLNKIYV